MRTDENNSERFPGIDGEIISLALPTAMDNLLSTAVGFVDSWIIAALGLVTVTGVGLANTVLNVYLAVFTALGIGVTSLIVRYKGGGDVRKAGSSVRGALLLATLTGMIFGVVTMIFSDSILALMGADSSVIESTSVFLRLVGGFSVMTSLMTVCASIIRATGDGTTPLKIGVVTNIVNIVLDLILIFGLGPVPALGLLGSAIGTVISRTVGFLLLFNRLQRTELKVELPGLFRLSGLKELIDLTVPATLERLAMRVGQLIYFSLIVRMGTEVFAAHSIAGTIESFSYMPGYGLALAATVLSGYAAGERNRERLRTIILRTVRLGIIVMGFLGVLLFFLSPHLARIFTGSPSAIGQIVTALRIDAFIQPILAVSLIVTGVLQGLGDTRTPLYSTLSGMWVIRTAGVFMSLRFMWGIAGVWIVIGTDLLMRAIYSSLVLRRRVLQIPSGTPKDDLHPE